MKKIHLLRTFVFLAVLIFILTQTTHTSFAKNNNPTAQKVRTAIETPVPSSTEDPYSKTNPQFNEKDSFSIDGLLLKKETDFRFLTANPGITVEYFTYDEKKRIKTIWINAVLRKVKCIYQYDDVSRTITKTDSSLKTNSMHVTKWFLNTEGDTVNYQEWLNNKHCDEWGNYFIYKNGKIIEKKHFTLLLKDTQFVETSHYFYSPIGKIDSMYRWYPNLGESTPAEIYIYNYDTVNHINTINVLDFKDRKTTFYFYKKEFDDQGHLLHLFCNAPPGGRVQYCDDYYSWNENGLQSSHYFIYKKQKVTTSVCEYTYY